MRRTLALGIFVGIVLYASLNRASGQDTAGQPAVAVVNGVTVTQTDLEQKKAANLLQAQNDYYVAQRKALDQLIDEILLEEQARRENVTVEELLNLHVNSQIKDPTEDQLEVFYEGLQTDQSFEDMRTKILDTIRQRRTAKARAQYLQSLRNASQIQILLNPPTAQVAVGDAPLTGPPNAHVTVIEFADYECPYCQEFYPDLKKLLKEFQNQIDFVYKDFPLPMHPHAEKASEAARCARAQGRFWEYHDFLFEKRRGLEVDQLKQDAKTLGLDPVAFDKCLDSGEQAAGIKQDLQQGQQLGLTGTPTLFINNHIFSGVTSYAVLREMLEQELQSSSGTNKLAAK